MKLITTGGLEEKLDIVSPTTETPDGFSITLPSY